MKTKKVLALLVLTAMIMSIVPAMAFGAISVDRSRVIEPEGSVAAIAGTIKVGDEGQEFKLIIVDPDTDFDEEIYIASSRSAVDRFFYSVRGNWFEVSYINGVGNNNTVGVIGGSYGDYALSSAISSTSKEITIKVISSAQGTSRIAFGLDSEVRPGNAWDNTLNYAYSRGGTDASYIIGGARYPITFTSPRAETIKLAHSPDSGKYANNVDSYLFTATVLTAGEVPASGIEVTFSIISGTGARLSATKATTNSSGKASVSVFSSRQGEVKIQAKATGVRDASNIEAAYFDSTGIISIKTEDAADQKVARVTGNKQFGLIAYDVNGVRVDFLGLGIDKGAYSNLTNPRSIADLQEVGESDLDFEERIPEMYVGADQKATKLELYADVTKKPTGASLAPSHIFYSVNVNSGDLWVNIPYDRLNRDGDYEVKIYLANGTSVVYTFNVRDQGDIVKITLSYGSTSFAAGSYLPPPTVTTEDADGYKEWFFGGSYLTANTPLGISDASFLDGKIGSNGAFKLKDDKSGLITMTLIDKTLNIVADPLDINIQKPASYLKLTAPSVTAVGGEANVTIELVDIDGQLAAVGIEAESASATIITRPADSVASASNVDISSFKNGKASVKVSCNAEGDVIVRAIITEVIKNAPWTAKPNPDYDATAAAAATPANPYDEPEFLYETYGGRTYTGITTVSFGKASAGAGTLIFIIGAPSFVSGTTPYAAESPAFIENGRTFLGVRDIGTAIGATVEWDQDTQTATLSKDNITVKVTVGSDSIAVTKGGVTTEVATDAAAVNKDGRVYLPFRVLLEAFGYTVTWDDATQAIICTI